MVASLDDLNALSDQSSYNDALFEIWDAKHQMEQLFDQSIYSPYLRVSREKAKELHAALEEIIALSDDDAVKPLGWRAFSVKQALENFKLVFLSEISTLPAFLVSKKGPYDMNLLVERGADLFPQTLLVKVPEAFADAVEVGRALAFGLGTSCGFHAFRVTESVLRRYWDHVSKGAGRPSLQTIGSFAAELEKAKLGDRKISESLKQFSKLHRNPCIHPDVILSEEEAIGIIGMARSVIAAMLAAMPDVPPTTSLPVLPQ